MRVNGSTSWWILAAIFWFAALLLFVGGYLIRVRRKMRLLAGYRPEEVIDKDGLARHAGGILWWMGAITLSVPLLLLVLPRAVGTALVAVGYGVAVLVLALWLAITSRRYMR